MIANTYDLSGQSISWTAAFRRRYAASCCGAFACNASSLRPGRAGTPMFNRLDGSVLCGAVKQLVRLHFPRSIGGVALLRSFSTIIMLRTAG